MVGWGDMTHFMPAVAALNPWFPSAWIPFVAWTTTIAEIVLGILLLIGLETRWASRLSGCLLLAFAIGMTAGRGVKFVFDASVLAACGGAFMLATAERYAWSLDALRGVSQSHRHAAVRTREISPESCTSRAIEAQRLVSGKVSTNRWR